jgi:hypothetical protein
MEETIWRTAHVLIELHGDEAALFAAWRADELFAKDDFVGCAYFHRVARAIQELDRRTPRGGETAN